MTADGILDGIFHPFDIDFVVFDDGVGSPRVAVARQADAAGVDDELVAHFQNIGLMRMADAYHVGVHVPQAGATKNPRRAGRIRRAGRAAWRGP